jgi:CubicO group peptidase (beta-lactamase class C family)
MPSVRCTGAAREPAARRPARASFLLERTGAACGLPETRMRLTRRLASLALVPALFLPAAAAGAAAPELDPVTLREELAAIVRQEMDARHLPGAVVVVVDRERVLLAEGFGFADLASRTPVDPARTGFRVASVSKLFTSTAVMQLVERGEVDLDRDLATYVGDLELPRRGGRAITPRHLLTHTSGLSEGFLGSLSRTREEWLPLRDYLARGLPAQHAPAGEVVSYANYGMGLAGLLVESVSREPFHVRVSHEILQPLGMGRSSFGMEPAVLDGLAQAYVFASGSHRPVALDFRNNLASGGLVTTGLDMARFLRAFLNGGELEGARILRPETVSAMLTRQWSPHPALAGVGLGFWELEIDGRPCWGHDGDVPGWNARALLAPEQGLGVFLAYTGTDTLKAFADRAGGAVLAQVVPKAAHERLPRADGDAARRAEGLYRWTRNARATPDRLLMPYWLVQYRARAGASGELELAQPLGIFPPSRFEPVGADLFQEIGGNRRLALRVQDGAVTHLVLERSPIPMSFERIHALESVPAQAALFVLFLVSFVALAVGGALGARRARARGWIAAASAANLAFLVGFPRAMGLQLYFSDLLPLPEIVIPPGTAPFFFGTPPAAQLLLALPVVALAITALLVARAALAPRAGGGGLRVPLVAFAALELAFAAFLRYWNLLGWTA